MAIWGGFCVFSINQPPFFFFLFFLAGAEPIQK
jgi:hypothetical protein